MTLSREWFRIDWVCGLMYLLCIFYAEIAFSKRYDEQRLMRYERVFAFSEWSRLGYFRVSAATGAAKQNAIYGITNRTIES